jgi:NagD protein
MGNRRVVADVTSGFAGYGLDLDGTVYLDNALVPGADEAIAELRERGARLVFATNKPLESSAAYATRLSKLGIPAEPTDVVTALDALAAYLTRHHRGARLLTIAEALVDEVCVQAGFEVVDEPDSTDVVVVSFDRGFSYGKLLAAYQAVGRGAAIVATNPDPYCPTAAGGLPDCAAMLAALEACTGRTAEAIVGKPSRYMGQAILDRLQVPAEIAAFVGDRVETDVAMARTLGMAAVLVMSGATSETDLQQAGIAPDYVIPTVRDLPHLAPIGPLIR